MAIEVTADEFVDLCFGRCMQVLELVHGLKLDDVQSVGKDTIRLPLQEMLALVGSYMRNRCEDVGAMRG